MNPNPINYNNESRQTLSSHFIDFIQTLVVFAAIGSAIYLFVAQPHKVSGSSMDPNFHDGDYIITDKISYHFSEPKRGEVIVFKNPREESQDFIKRVIGLPGDKIRLDSGYVYLNGQKIAEPYLNSNLATEPGSFSREEQEIVIPQNKLFVLGDNRNKSSDSREWGFVRTDEIIGRVFLRYWPKDAIGFFPANYALK